ncbi:Abi-alpha family protein [Bradyrhizobium sp. USDA 4451]
MSEHSEMPYEKAIEETAKTTGKALDLARAMSPAIANAYGLLIGDRIAAARERNLDAITRKTQKILEERNAQDNAKPIPEQLGVQLLEHAQGETRETIQDLYAALLANAMDEHFARDVRPEFIQVVSQLQPIDAMILNTIKQNHMEPSRRVFGSNHICEALENYRPTAIEVSLEHLRKLGCLGSHAQGTVISNFGIEFMTACDPHADQA